MLERTVPRDGCKEAFIRNFVCLINDYGSIPKVPMLQAFRVFAEWDNYPAPEGNWAQQNAKRVMVALTNMLARIGGWVGYKGLYEEYTPRKLYEKLSK